MRNRLVALVACLVASTAYAAGLAVSPILVELGESDRTALVKVTNGDTVPQTYQLEMKAWSESRSGQMELQPTKDVIFFPQILSLAPGESRNVRVGITTAPSAIERGYRLFIQEMPKRKLPGQKAAVQVLTRVGIPVFVTPQNAQPQIALSSPAIVNGEIQITVSNQGTAYVRPESVSVTLLDKQGGQVFQKTWNGWYILAHGERDYSAKLPPGECKKGVNLRAEVIGEGKSLASKTGYVDSKACGT